MSSQWHPKKAKKELEAFEREQAAIRDSIDFEGTLANDTKLVANGGGEEELFEKKLSKEEKKALAKAKREAKKKAKGVVEDGPQEKTAAEIAQEALESAKSGLNEEKDLGVGNAAADALASEGTICTFSTSTKGVDDRSRDINVQDFTLLHKGMVMLDHTEIVLNHGNRYGLIGRNGCGKTTLMKALGARAVPIPGGIDTFHLKEEIEASDTVTALQAVMAVDEERERLEKEAENLNNALSALSESEDTTGSMSFEEQQEQIMELLNTVYERLDELDAATAETRARSILKGLGFTHEMQSKKTKDFSGGWRMRVSLARALFIQPTLLLLDEPTNHLDMEAVIWLEDYLSNWNKILLLISHSQDFLNNVCTHMIHFTSNDKKLITYDGNYDQFIKTKAEQEENQLKKYEWEQDQIKSMKEYIARFGHGTSKNAKQAQSKEKVLEKMIRAGLTPKPEQEKVLNFKFPDPGHLPPPVLAFHDVSFGYPNCEPLYSNVNFGVDLDSRVGKTTEYSGFIFFDLVLLFLTLHKSKSLSFVQLPQL
jgi:ATP-binding cassette subfamily F protein 2